ncbi:hypothetical protein KDL01_25825 [Actinospica durhamensis]|uniref:Uncharacterized protein n=1 Tax=Actinospica durhamensis TaxID=1508375 RepID=A0A941IV97_9ACTN|nr:hypothetical protein [Actinospica durhamensis]MBR7836726.1 hypothetical protein [Actinospica durhamensis]
MKPFSATRAIMPALPTPAPAPGAPADQEPQQPRRTREFDSALPAAVLQAAEWRYLVRMLYMEAGSPEVPGYPRHLVQEVLWGSAYAGAGFFEAMLTTLSRSPAHRNIRLLRRAVPGELGLARPHSEEPAIVVSQDGILRVRPTVPVEAGAALGPKQEAPTRAKHGYTPPNPGQIESVPAFVEALRLLLTWSGMKLRELEEQSKLMPDSGADGRAVWLARSTVSDMFRRKGKLPKAEMVRALTAVCGLTAADQERWLQARARLEDLSLRGKRAGRRPAAARRDGEKPATR